MKSSDRERSEDSRPYPDIHAGARHDPPKNQKEKKFYGGGTSDVNHAQYSLLMPKLPISVEAQRWQATMD
jgi:hypothetical protein